MNIGLIYETKFVGPRVRYFLEGTIIGLKTMRTPYNLHLFFHGDMLKVHYGFGVSITRIKLGVKLCQRYDIM